MLYDSSFVKDGMNELIKVYSGELASVTVDIENGFGNPKIVDLAKYLDDSGDKDWTDVMIRQMCVGRTVTFKIDGEMLGQFKMNNVNDAWEVFPVIQDYPYTWKMLADIVAVHLKKKSTPPPKKQNQETAAVTS